MLVWRSILPERPPTGGDGDLTRWRNVANAALELQRLAMDRRAAARDQPLPDGHDDHLMHGRRDAVHGDEGGAGPQGESPHPHLPSGNNCQDGRWRVNPHALALQIEEAIANVNAIMMEAAGAAERGEERDMEQVRLVQRILDALAVVRDGDVCGDGFKEGVAETRAAITKCLDEVADESRKRNLEAWTSWMRRGVDSGARNAHKYTKIPQVWRPHAVVTPDGVVSANPANVVDALRTKYVRRWNGVAGGASENEPRRHPPWGEVPRCSLPKPSVADLRQASRAFAADTATTYDGFAMRHYALISDVGLAVLGDIMIAMETIGRLPPQLNAILMPLIGKDRGGFRAITLATSLYRLWGRVRRPYSQEWEARHDRPFFASGKGRRVQDVVWRQMLRAEAGCGRGLASAAILWDLASFYDTVNRARLWRLARRHEYPMPIARLAMSAYDAPRAIAMEGRLSRPTYARNGVPAGCPFANSFVQLFCVDAFDDFVADVKEEFGDAVTFDAYIDDLVVSICAEEHRVAGIARRVADMLRMCIEDRMGCQVEISKASVVASSNKIVMDIAWGLGSYAGPAGRRTSTVNLGCDFAPGRRRTAQSQSGKRLRRHLAMRRRARKLAKARRALGDIRRSKRIFTTGILAAATHDAAVNGLSDREAMALRRTAATACTPRARGRSLALVTLLNGVPTWRAEAEVVLQYARQVWASALQGHHRADNGTMSLTEIADAWRAADKQAIFSGRIGGDGTGASTEGPGRGGGATAAARRAEAMWDSDGRRRNWREVRGPVAAMLLTLHRIGWSMESPFTMKDDWGEDIVLTKVAPSMLAQMLREATVRTLERYAGRRAALHDEEFRGRRVCIDHIRSQLASDKSLTHEGRAAFLSVMCNAIMTFNRAAQGGYLVEDICPKCGRRGDTVRHRVWECEHPDVAAARNAVAPSWLREEMSRRPASQSRWVTGIIPHPGDIWPRPAEDAQPVADFVGGGSPRHSDEGIPRIGGKIYVDGSCTQNVIPELRRAATSLIACADDGDPQWIIRMAVPTPMPQTSQSAEFVALPLAHAYLKAAACDFDLASDCANVVRACLDKGTKALQGAKRYAGLLKPIVSDPEWRRRVAVRKVAAHVTHDALPDGPEKDDAKGNELADAQAKRALNLHPPPPPTVKQGLDADLRRARLIIRTIAATIVHFPPMPRERMQRRPVAREGATIHGRGGHRWKFMSGCWRCEVCWTLTVKPEIDAALAHRRCGGPKVSIEASSIADRGHRVAYAEGQMPVLFCLACGSYSARRAYGLGAQCPGVASKAGSQALARIRRGYQPWRTRHDRGQQRPRLEASAAWSDARCELVAACGEGGAARRRRGTAPLADADEDVHEPAGKRHCCGDATPRNDGEAAAAPMEDVNGDFGLFHLDATRGHDVVGARSDIAHADTPMDVVGFDGYDDFDIFGHGGSLDQAENEQGDRADIVIATASEPGADLGECSKVETIGGDHGGSAPPAADNRIVDAADIRISRWVPRMAGSSTDPPMERLAESTHAADRVNVISDVSEQSVAGANGISNNAVNAREGLGAPHPHEARVTVAASSSFADGLAATVRADCEAAPLHLQDSAARGPPSAYAAALGGYKGDTARQWPAVQSPLKRPRSLGAGPSKFGRTTLTEQGDPTPGVEWRRDGVDAPASALVVARGGSDATAEHWGEGPSRGPVRRVLDARNGCATESGDDGDDGGIDTFYGDARDIAGCGARADDNGENAELLRRHDVRPRHRGLHVLPGPPRVRGRHWLEAHHRHGPPSAHLARPPPPPLGGPDPHHHHHWGGGGGGPVVREAGVGSGGGGSALGAGASVRPHRGGREEGEDTPRDSHVRRARVNPSDFNAVRPTDRTSSRAGKPEDERRAGDGGGSGLQNSLRDRAKGCGELPTHHRLGEDEAVASGGADLGDFADVGIRHANLGCGDPGAAIRGRRQSPGRGSRDAAAGVNSGIMDASDGAAAGQQRRAAARPASSARDANEYVMHAYLDRHSDRVRKRKQLEAAEGRPPAETASQRLAALRSRVAIRLNASRRSESDMDLRDAPSAAADLAADAASSASASCVAWHTADPSTRLG